jgi:hypothetical protein
MTDGQQQPRFSIDPKSVAQARADLQAIVKGIPIAEAAVEGFSDWEAIEGLERLWAAAGPMEPDGAAIGSAPDWLALLESLNGS